MGKTIYVRAVSGFYQRLRRYMGGFFLILFAAIPWVNYGDRQAIWLDLSSQQFYFFGTTLWPQDLNLLAILFILAAFSLFFITTFLGRVWCGYLCPQTIWSFMFIWFEQKLEGNANKRRKLDSLPFTKQLLLAKTIKHLCWLGISFFTAVTFIGYFIAIRSLMIDFIMLNSSFWPVFWVSFFTVCTYINAGWMREIVCLHICPYARFQSAMFDKDTFIVGYNHKRGEQRGARTRKQSPQQLGLGDCIDCKLCVDVCPTGIDIRNGLQYECINCGACVDACNDTMHKMGYQQNLISYTTEHKLAGKKMPLLRPKLVGYASASLVMLALFIYSLSTLQPMLLDVTKDRNQLYKFNNQGLIENTYHLKIINKTQQTETYTLSVLGLKKPIWYGKQQVQVAAGEIYNLPISLAVEPDSLVSPINIIEFKLERSADSLPKTTYTESRFISPK